MKVDLLRFKGAFVDELPSLIGINPLGFSQFAEAEAAHRPSLYVLRGDGLKSLLSVVNGSGCDGMEAGESDIGNPLGAPLILDKGNRVDQTVKKEGRTLPGYFFGHDRPVAVMGTYRSPKTLRNSVFKLIRQARETGERNLFLLGTADSVFDQLCSGAPNIRVSPLSFTERMLRHVPKRDVHPRLMDSIKGHSPEIKLLRTFVTIASSIEEPAKNPILILGESGTGKGLAAREIHNVNPSKTNQPFVTLNCAAIPSELLEAELFGIKPRTATNVDGREGKWKEAGEGTLFLDEIGDMRLDLQAKILHALNDCRFLPVGGSVKNNDVVVCRSGIIAATNRPLLQMVESGAFRKDLYFRLNKFVIQTYSLKQTPSDIEVLLRLFWPNQKDYPLSRGVLDELQAYPWPGNVREMKSLMNGLAKYFPQMEITVEILHLYWEFIGVTRIRGRAGIEAGSEGDKLKILRHLHQTQDVVTSCQDVFYSTFGKRTNRTPLETLQSSLQINMMRLNTLCVDAELFGFAEVYAGVQVLLGKLEILGLDVLPDGDHKSGRVFWRQEINEEVEKLQEALRVAKDKILDGLYGAGAGN